MIGIGAKRRDLARLALDQVAEIAINNGVTADEIAWLVQLDHPP